MDTLRRRKTIMLAAVALPAILALSSGRQTSLSTSQGTSQQRIQLWVTGFEMLRESPILGVGVSQFAKRAGLVAHNSFVHAFAELGLLGGTLFFGAYYHIITSLWRIGSKSAMIQNLDVRRMCPYALAAVTSCAVSQMSLSRCYSVTTYAILGVGAACIRLANSDSSVIDLEITPRWAFRLVRASLLFLIALYAFARLTVTW